MNSFWPVLLAILATALFVGAVAAVIGRMIGHADMEKDLADTHATIKARESEIGELEKELTRLTTERDEATEHLTKVLAENIDLKAALERATMAIKAQARPPSRPKSPVKKVEDV